MSESATLLSAAPSFARAVWDFVVMTAAYSAFGVAALCGFCLTF